MFNPNTVFFRLAPQGPDKTAVFFVARNTLQPLTSQDILMGKPRTLTTRVHVMGAKTQNLIYMTDRTPDVTRKMMEIAGFVFVNQALMNNPDRSWVDAMSQNWTPEMTAVNDHTVPIDILTGTGPRLSDEDWIDLARSNANPKAHTNTTQPRLETQPENARKGFVLRPTFLGQNNEIEGAMVHLHDLEEAESVLEEFFDGTLPDNTLTQPAWNALTPSKRHEICRELEDDATPAKDTMHSLKATLDDPSVVKMIGRHDVFVAMKPEELSQKLQNKGWLCLHDEHNVVARKPMLKPEDCTVSIWCDEVFQDGDQNPETLFAGRNPKAKTETHIFIAVHDKDHPAFDNLHEGWLTHPPTFLIDDTHPLHAEQICENQWSVDATMAERQTMKERFLELGYRFKPGTA